MRRGALRSPSARQLTPFAAAVWYRYNHISNAVWNLSSHLRGAGGSMPSEHVERISSTIDELNQARPQPPRHHASRALPQATTAIATATRTGSAAPHTETAHGDCTCAAYRHVGSSCTLRHPEQLLDVEEPYNVVVNDPTGASLFKPADGVKIVSLGSALDDDAEDPD